jgi:hypothetical protein
MPINFKITTILAMIVLALSCEVPPVAATEIGVYYFPGWISSSRFWKDLKGLPDSQSPGKPWPDREPLLGFYPEEEKWVAEQHIDWAASNGITFFAYDWYWGARGVRNNHAIDNYLHAKNKNKLKFSLLWANHDTEPSSLNQFTAMVDYWLEHYLADPQYLKVDGKPVVIIFSPQQLRDRSAKFGKTTAELFELARQKAKAKGLKGIYFVGCMHADSSWVSDYLPKNGYDAITAYNYHTKGFRGECKGSNVVLSTSYSELVDGYKSNWDWILKNSSLPYFIPLTSGWDKRPWGSNKEHDKCGGTPVEFKKMLVDAKAIMTKYPEKTKGIALIYAWNEFGEGAYIEPTKKWGMQFLQAIKDVFGK